MIHTPPNARTGPLPPWVKWGMMLSWRQAALMFIAMLTLVRIWLLYVSPFDLGPDEAQYWSWSRDFAFGYFSKPPVIGWVIGFSTAVCTGGEACVRLASPLFHGATALMLFFLAQRMFNDRTAFWTSVLYATLPGIWFSAGLITTDVPLLFFWSVALLALYAFREERSWPWALLLGAAIGFGLMSKYAMLYFLIGMGLLTVFDIRTREALLGARAVVALIVAAAIFAPNIWWNAAHDFSTVTHTAANANWGANLFNFDKFLEFVAGQFGIFGPLLFGGLVVALFQLARRWKARGELDDKLLWLAAFVVPALAVGLVQAFISRANANWAASAYVAATPLVVAWLLTGRWRALLPASFVLHNAFGFLLAMMVVFPTIITWVGQENSFKRVRGWEEIGKYVERHANAGFGDESYTAVVTNDRLTFAELLYYAPDLTVPLTIWDQNGIAENHYELTAPLTSDNTGLVLLVGNGRRVELIAARFERAEKIDTLSVNIGGGRTRDYEVYVLYGETLPAE